MAQLGLIEKGLSAAERRHEKRVRKVVSGSLEPGEEVLAWFHAMAPGETAQRVRAARAAAGASFVQHGGLFMTRRGVEVAVDAGTRVLRGWLVLTDRRVLKVSTNLTGGKPKAVQASLRYDMLASVERLESSYRLSVHTIHFGITVTDDGTPFVFEIPPYAARAFDRFTTELDRLR